MAFALLLACGMGYRVFWNWYMGGPPTPRLKPGTLAKLPYVLGTWSGRDQPHRPGVLELLAATDQINRDYFQRGTDNVVGLFISYGARPRDLMPHRPEVCYPAAGWAMETRTQTSIWTKDTTWVPAELYHFHRSGLASSRMAALSYWIVDGQYYSDISGFRWQVLRPGAGSQYVIQVHISSAIRTSTEATDQMVLTFAHEAAPAIYNLVTRASEESSGTTAPSIR